MNPKAQNLRSIRSAKPVRRRGTVLIVTMTVTFTLAAVVMVLSRRMAVEAIASANQAAAVQADAVERGAEQYVIALLNQQASAGNLQTFNVQVLTDDYFAQVPVGADTSKPDGWFWLLRPNYEDSTLPVFGIVDESSKLNLNVATNGQFMGLPGMTQDVADAISDWHDQNDLPDAGSQTGAESDYYLAQSNPYYAKNQDMETVSELLMVRGMTDAWLYGDGTAPPLGSYDNAISNAAGLNADPMLSHGLYDLLTVHSAIPAPGGNGSIVGQTNLNTAPRSVIAAFFYQQAGQNINAALQQADQIVQARADGSAFGTADTTWLAAANLTTGNLGQTFGNIPGLNVNGNPVATVFAGGLEYRYSADILAVSSNGRAFKRTRVIFDTSNYGYVTTNGVTVGTQILQRRDMTDRRWPMPQSVLDSLRAGNGPGTVAGGGGVLNSTIGGR